MPSVVVRPRALADLADIWAYIAEDSVKHADRFAAVINTQFRTLARRPHMGRSRPELATALRSFPVGRYVIFYVPLPKGVEIVRVLHGGTSSQSCTTRNRRLARFMRHLMPIVTPRLVLRPPMLDDLDAIQAAKEEAWNDLQLWMAWAFDDQRPRQAMEQSIRRVMNFQSQAGIALAGFHRINGDFVVRTALDLTDEADVYETGFWVARKYAGQGMATEAANAAIRYAFGCLGAKAISIGHFDGNDASHRIVEKLGFQKLRVARQAATRCLDGTRLDRHEYILTSPDVLPKLDVSWG
jgi:toxin ParE1/3/4